MEQHTQQQKMKFSPGRIFASARAVREVDPEDMHHSLSRHLLGNWGDVCKEDWEENDLGVREGFRLLSVYHDRQGVKFWIITDAVRMATTVLLPEDY